MNVFRVVALLGLLAGQAYAQQPGEIAFWESVRDTKNPAELRAYLQQFPNGIFKALAEARLAALEQGGAKPAPPPTPQLVTGEKHVPKAGDVWIYRLSYPRLRGQWGKTQKPARKYVVTLVQAGDASISDELSIDGSAPIAAQHARGATLLQHGAAIFSPYFMALGGGAGALGPVQINEPACNSTYVCTASIRMAGTEVLAVPAGRFTATKYIVEENWRPISGSLGRPGDASQMTGGRTLTVWYAPQVGRAVKYESRLIVGDMPPMDDPNFDLELVSFAPKG